jgi:DNA polymerase-3 subunit delta
VQWQAGDVAGSVQDVIAACDTLPMMSERRVTLVSVPAGDEKSLTLQEAKKLAAYIERVPQTALLILTAASVAKSSALYKAFASHGREYEFARLGRSDLRAFVSQRFKRAGAEASDDVVSEIIKVSGYLDRDAAGDLFGMESDIAGIIAYARGGEAVADARPTRITAADVAACLGTSLETDVWAMLDAVSAGRKGDAMNLLQSLAARGDNAFGMLALMTSQFEIMLGYRELKELGIPFKGIAGRLGVRSEYRLKKAAGFADRYDAARLARLLHRLYRVDRDIKSGLYGERLALTMFVAEM